MVPIIFCRPSTDYYVILSAWYADLGLKLKHKVYLNQGAIAEWQDDAQQPVCFKRVENVTLLYQIKLIIFDIHISVDTLDVGYILYFLCVSPPIREIKGLFYFIITKDRAF